jgi:hypothetical protein
LEVVLLSTDISIMFLEAAIAPRSYDTPGPYSSHGRNTDVSTERPSQVTQAQQHSVW